LSGNSFPRNDLSLWLSIQDAFSIPFIFLSFPAMVRVSLPPYLNSANSSYYFQPVAPSSSTSDPAAAAAKALTPPTGWSNDPDYMDRDYYWQGKNGDLKATLNTWYGLANAEPLCTRLPDFGDVMFLFQSGSKYYVWNGIENVVCSIEEPKTLEQIYSAISKLGGGRLGDLKLKKLTQKRA
jgi:hypothetical protein